MIWLALVLAAVGSGWIFGHGDLGSNLLAARESLAADLVGLLLGAAVGRMERDRLRLRRTYASPSLAHLAKLLAFLSLGVVATYLFSPVDWDPAWLHAGVAATAVGICVWMGNLPLRL